MNLESDLSNTRHYNATYVDNSLKEAVESHIAELRDKSEARLLSSFFESVRAAVQLKALSPSALCQDVALDEGDILRIAYSQLFHGQFKDLSKAIACLNKAIMYVNTKTAINLPPVDPTKIAVKSDRQLAVKIDAARWAAYNKVELLYEHFINKFEVVNDEEELALAGVFSIIKDGAFFHNAHVSIMDVSLSDFSPHNSYIMLSKHYTKKRDPQQIKSRLSLSAISVIYLLRAGAKSSLRPKADDDKLFPQSLRQNFIPKFRQWLQRLVTSFNQNRVGLSKDGNSIEPLDKLTIRDLYKGAQIWTGMKYPFFTTSYLCQKIVPGQLSSTNYRAQFSHDLVVYPPMLHSGKKRQSWSNLKMEEQDENDGYPLNDEYITLMNIDAKVSAILKKSATGGKKGRALAAAEITVLAESLPYPASTMNHRENGYISNYALLLEWLAELLVEKDNVDTVSDYFGDLGNSLFFILGDTCISALDKYELMDVVFELIHSSPSPQTRRNYKNKAKQFLRFLAKRYRTAALDWNHPDLWICDIPMEREILGLGEFDKVIEYLEGLEDRDYADMVKALIILLFYAGLRIHEAALLTHGAIYVDTELNIMIKKSKTRAGKRSLPLHYILLQEAVIFLRQFVLKRRPKGSRKGIPLFSPNGASFYDPDSLAAMVTNAISGALGRHITCHQLRHSFASWLLVRWYALVYGTETLSTIYADHSHTAFSEPELEKIRTLLVGEGPERIGSKYFMHSIRAISRLLGHASPDTTVNVYVHTVDILYRLFVVERDSSTRVSVARAATILNVSNPTARKVAGGAKTVKLSALLEYCMQTYPLPVSIVRVRGNDDISY